MKATVHDTYGSVGTLELRDVDRPEIVDDEVLIPVCMPLAWTARCGTS